MSNSKTQFTCSSTMLEYECFRNCNCMKVYMFTRFNEKVIIVQCCLWLKRPRLTHLYLSHISFLSI